MVETWKDWQESPMYWDYSKFRDYISTLNNKLVIAFTDNEIGNPTDIQPRHTLLEKQHFHGMLREDMIMVFNPTSIYKQLSYDNDGITVSPFLMNSMQLMEYYAQCLWMFYFLHALQGSRAKPATALMMDEITGIHLAKHGDSPAHPLHNKMQLLPCNGGEDERRALVAKAMIKCSEDRNQASTYYET